MTDQNRKDRALWLGQNILPHEPILRAWLERRGRGGLEVDDIVQETFAILQELDSIDEIRNPRNYAFQVAYSIIQRHMRRQRVVSFQLVGDMNAMEITSDEPSPESEVSDRSDLKLVEEYIAGLPPKCRDVLILRRIHGLSYREISERLDIPENGVDRLLSKAARLLLEAFGRGGNRRRQTSKGEEEASSTVGLVGKRGKPKG